MPKEGYAMLVLTRRVDQILTLGDPHSTEPPIEIQVIEVRGDQVRLGVKAPRSTEVHRKEIWEQKQREKEQG